MPCTKRSQGFYCCTLEIFDGLTQSCKSVFFCTVCHLSLHVGFFSLRVTQGFLYRHVAMVKSGQNHGLNRGAGKAKEGEKKYQAKTKKCSNN